MECLYFKQHEVHTNNVDELGDMEYWDDAKGAGEVNAKLRGTCQLISYRKLNTNQYKKYILQRPKVICIYYQRAV